MKKQTVRLNEAQLHELIKESVKKVLKESELGDRVQALRKQSKTYRGDECGSELRLGKIWNSACAANYRHTLHTPPGLLPTPDGLFYVLGHKS